MTALTEFLLARITEDERRSSLNKGVGGFHTVDCGVNLGYWANDECICDGPTRILAECAAKRAIIACGQEVKDYHDEYAVELRDVSLMALAAVYADHPDYGKGWEV